MTKYKIILNGIIISMKSIEEFIGKFKNIINFIILIATLVTFKILSEDYINNRIEKRITDDKYIEKLSTVLRPFLIFNDNGIVTYDHGGLKYIQDIKLSKNKGGYLKKIVITTNDIFLNNAPILNCIGSDNYSFESSRSGNYSWEYKVGGYVALSAETDESPSQTYDNIWILDILK